ncbi:MAG TPA: YceI family protein [Chitinophagaceae bacterium]|nr:YceI family protein [Chitinophagaceae bacterium]
MKKLLSFLVVALLCTPVFAQTVWKSDPFHSKLTFSITHLGISDVAGLFKTFNATLIASKADFSDAVFELSADVASINTEVEERDHHLRSADFFEVEKYPTMTFKSTSIKKTSKDKYKLTGNLTLHGITKPVTMDLWYRGTIENPVTKATTAGFQLLGNLTRFDFGIGSKFPAPFIGDKVSIKADGEFLKK